MQPFYMLKGIPGIKFTLMEKNMSLNLSLVKMPHSVSKTELMNLTEEQQSGQTFDYTSERDMKMKL